MNNKREVLFVCTGNAGRSQMAEAIFRKIYGKQFEVFSAGVEPWDHLHPMALKLMEEEGIDMSGHYPKHVNDFLDRNIDFVITIGDRAENETGDFQAGTRRIHWPINDPADADGTPESEDVFRYTRNAVSDKIPGLSELFSAWENSRETCLQSGISSCVFRFEDIPGDQKGIYAFSPGEHIPLLKKTGFDFIELCCYFDQDFPWENKSAIKELRKAALDNDISVWSVHTPELRLNHNTENLPRKLDIIRRFVDICQELKSGVLVLHYFPECETYDGQIPDIFNQLDNLVRETPVTLCLETLQSDGQNKKLMTLFDYLNTGSFGAVIDTGHSFVAGDLYGQILKLGNKIKGLHLHDNNGKSDQHQIPGKGLIDWTRVLSELKSIGFQGPFMLEVNGGKENSSTMDSFLQQCKQSIEIISTQKKVVKEEKR